MKITGFDRLQKQLDEAQRGFAALDGEIGTVRFNPRDPSSIQAAVAEVEYLVDAKAASFRGNPLVDAAVQQLKGRYRSAIEERAAAARAVQVTSTSRTEDFMGSIDVRVLDQIENAIRDLRNSELQTFERPLKLLAKLLHSPGIAEVRDELTSRVDWNAFLAASEKTGGGMAGSHKLLWPEDQEQYFGLVLVMIEKMADAPEWATNFCFQYFYSGSKIVAGVHTATSQILVPFARDFRLYLSEKKGALPGRRAVGNARKIFIVHGHDEGAREGVARFCEKIGFEAIILHEQASRGMTIPQKLEAYGDVGFAIVLLTPDDLGRSVAEDDLRPRARQNVILELGYFAGRLGADRVCALKRGEIDLPSDYVGVVYVEHDDAGGWRAKLGKELEAAGFEIDWNLVMKG
jgi:hypothetical protein